MGINVKWNTLTYDGDNSVELIPQGCYVVQIKPYSLDILWFCANITGYDFHISNHFLNIIYNVINTKIEELNRTVISMYWENNGNDSNHGF